MREKRLLLRSEWLCIEPSGHPGGIFDFLRTFEYLLARMIKRANKLLRVKGRKI